MDITIIDNPQEVEQRSEEWFNLRLGRITGSRFPSLMPSTRQKPDEFNKTQETILKELAVERLTGAREEGFTNQYMQWGTEIEPLAIENYETDQWCKVKEVGFYPFKIDDIDWFGDSPDGIIEGVKCIEIKCPKSTTHFDYLLDPKKLVKAYEWQCYGHMIATGLKQCDLISFDPRFPEGKQLVIVTLDYDEAKAKLLKDRLLLCNQKIEGWVNA